MKKNFEVTFHRCMTPDHVQALVKHFSIVVKKRTYQTYRLAADNPENIFRFGMNVNNNELINRLYLEHMKAKCLNNNNINNQTT